MGAVTPETCTVTFISVINQLDAQNLFHNKFYFMPLHVSSTCAHNQEVKIALHSFWYHDIYSWPSRARNKLTVKQKCYASSWLITEINVPNEVYS